MYVCMYVCMYVYIYIHMYIYSTPAVAGLDVRDEVLLPEQDTHAGLKLCFRKSTPLQDRQLIVDFD